MESKLGIPFQTYLNKRNNFCSRLSYEEEILPTNIDVDALISVASDGATSTSNPFLPDNIKLSGSDVIVDTGDQLHDDSDHSGDSEGGVPWQQHHLQFKHQQQQLEEENEASTSTDVSSDLLDASGSGDFSDSGDFSGSGGYDFVDDEPVEGVADDEDLTTVSDSDAEFFTTAPLTTTTDQATTTTTTFETTPSVAEELEASLSFPPFATDRSRSEVDELEAEVGDPSHSPLIGDISLTSTDVVNDIGATVAADVRHDDADKSGFLSFGLNNQKEKLEAIHFLSKIVDVDVVLTVACWR